MLFIIIQIMKIDYDYFHFPKNILLTSNFNSIKSMKKRSLLRIGILLMFLIIYTLDSSSQAPALINYQGIIRDNNGVPISEADKSVRFTILQGSPTGSQVFTETHGAHTNAFGLVNLKIGSISSGIGAINWETGPFYLKVEVDGTDLGTTQIISVPYAMYAARAGNGFRGNSPYYIDGNVGIGTNDPKSTLSVAGTTPNDSAIFEVKNNNGNTVFAVYNEGVRVYVDETTKASKGGFAIGGITSVKGATRDYFRVGGDSIRMYIANSSGAKGVKGGFAIGGFDNSKAGESRYMTISSDEGTNSGYNTFLGYKAGNSTGSGTHNIGIGYYAGTSLSTGRNNIFIGDSSGLYTSFGYENIFIGRNSGAKVFGGYNNIYIGYKAGSEGWGQYNVFIGDEAGRYNNNGYNNVFVGDKAGRAVTSGYGNTLLGSASGWKMTTGYQNVILGNTSGFSIVNGRFNTFIGNGSGNTLVSGTQNVFVGMNAGNRTEGSGNIFIGNDAGKDVTSATGRLVIDNTTRANIENHFINGDIPNYKLRFNSSVGIWTNPDPAYTLTVSGNILAGAFNTSSDERLKENIESISEPLKKVLSIRGVSYNLKDDKTSVSGKHIGFIAQEVLPFVPEVVNTTGEYYSMEYAPITALLVEAVKELKKENDQLREKLAKIDELEEQIESLKNILFSSTGK